MNTQQHDPLTTNDQPAPADTATPARRQRRWLPRHYWALLLVLMAAYSVGARLLHGLNLAHSGLLYVALPFFLALAMLLFSNAPYRGFYGFLRGSAIVLLGSSAILHEGFLCVLFLAPIYFLMVGLAYGVYVLWRNWRAQRSRLQVSVLTVPVLILVLLSSVEGVTPATTVSREQSVQVSLEVPLAVSEVRQRLLTPRLLPVSKDWLLRLFPMPYRIDAPGVQVGAEHEWFFEYRRWIVTNIQRGSIRLRLDQVGDRRIVVRVLSDNSYLATYLGLQQNRMDMLPLPGGGTRVSMTISFERRLDPAWYFQPLQRYVMQAMGTHILQNFLNQEQRHDG